MAVKLQLDISKEYDALWKEVQKFKIEKDMDNLNDAVIQLLKAGLKAEKVK